MLAWQTFRASHDIGTRAMDMTASDSPPSFRIMPENGWPTKY